MTRPKGIRNKKGESWLPYDEKYLISNFGRWYSLKHRKIIKQFKNNSGYYRANLSYQGKTINVFTHIKVVELFGDKNGNRIPAGAVSLREHGLSIDHVSRKKRDNAIFNLELVTHQENCARKFLMKTA
ncbi:MAG: hypothetical protein A2084_01625 [Tenericutes bacterium GWC2_39_45]|nr:MAG: hypothetical protein A2Y43_03880 [Tenericutes bacterium GWA2_38_26]OHE31195.1 MAG: hypothetical protein A2084_01625 [Tenericutes bacterium GWC2_39_45]OHE31673.1 MAG: hypothetical protein A2009_01760 [Tenericutes bacterium GWD2_38_27]